MPWPVKSTLIVSRELASVTAPSLFDAVPVVVVRDAQDAGNQQEGDEDVERRARGRQAALGDKRREPGDGGDADQQLEQCRRQGSVVPAHHVEG